MPGGFQPARLGLSIFVAGILAFAVAYVFNWPAIQVPGISAVKGLLIQTGASLIMFSAVQVLNFPPIELGIFYWSSEDSEKTERWIPVCLCVIGGGLTIGTFFVKQIAVQGLCFAGFALILAQDYFGMISKNRLE